MPSIDTAAERKELSMVARKEIADIAAAYGDEYKELGRALEAYSEERTGLFPEFAYLAPMADMIRALAEDIASGLGRDESAIRLQEAADMLDEHYSALLGYLMSSAILGRKEE